jgi:predicted metal-binding membrane protein
VEAVLRRERILVGGCLTLLVLASWGYLVDMARDMSGMSMTMPMSAGMVMPWEGRDLAFLFLMWAVMMVAMMVPSAAPMVLAFLSVNQRRQETSRRVVSTSIFVLGYLTVWTLFSALATAAQWGFHEAALISESMAVTSPVVTGVLQIVAGIYQWTPFKNRCLVSCRSPLSFLMSRWREGRLGALQLGLEHGAYFTGCCWLLMALLFVTGVMNLAAVALITAFVIAEKVVPRGEILARVAGIVLGAVGGTFLIRSF